MKMEVQVINRSEHDLPVYETDLSEEWIFRANISEDIELSSLERVLVPTGLLIALPAGTEAQIRPRSGRLAYKHGLTSANSPGTIDADYRGEVKVLLVNLSNEPFSSKMANELHKWLLQSMSKFSGLK